MNRFVLRGNVFTAPVNELLDLLCCRSGPRTSRHGDAHGDFRIFSLRHGCVTEPAPNEHPSEHHPGNVWMLNKEPSDIATIADVLIFFVCHFFYASIGELELNRRPSNRRLKLRRSFPQV